MCRRCVKLGISVGHTIRHRRNKLLADADRGNIQDSYRSGVSRDELAARYGVPRGRIYAITRGIELDTPDSVAIGNRYGAVTVRSACEPVNRNGNLEPSWVCVCDYGHIQNVLTLELEAGWSSTRRCHYCTVDTTLKRKNLTGYIGKKFGRFTVISASLYDIDGDDIRWLCDCSCGASESVSTDDLVTGKHASCWTCSIIDSLVKDPKWRSIITDRIETARVSGIMAAADTYLNP